MRRLHCGIDCGTTNVKVVLLDDEGRSVAVRAMPTPRADDPWGVSTDALVLVAHLEEMILDAWSVAGGGAPLRSIAVAGVGEDGVGVTEDGTPTGLAIACFDVYSRSWLPGLLAAAGAPPLPPLADAGDVVGTVTRGKLLSASAAADDTLVVAGGHDHPIAALAIRSVDPSARVDSLGTANLVYGEAAGPVPPRLDPWLAFSVPPQGHSGLACLGVYEFGANLASDSQSHEKLRAMLASDRLPGTPLAGDSSLRGKLEHACIVARRMMEAIDNAGAETGEIYATGGWAQSQGLLELRASVYGRSVHAIGEPELTAVGAACLGISASRGRFPDLRSTRGVRRIDPCPEWAGHYAAAYSEAKSRLDRERDHARGPE